MNLLKQLEVLKAMKMHLLLIYLMIMMRPSLYDPEPLSDHHNQSKILLTNLAKKKVMNLAYIS